MISVETHGKYYTNPFINEIINWMEKENYITWYKDASDTIFIKNNLFVPSTNDKIETKLAELKLRWKRFKRIFKNK